MDSLDSFTETRQQILDGPTSVRARDARDDRFETMIPPKEVDNYHRQWPKNNQPGQRSHSGPAKPFAPDASFEVLRNNNKLATEGNLNNEHLQTKYLMPGYTGFIRGRQHISGRDYGETTRRAYDTGYTEHVCTSPIPSDPQKNRRIQHESLKDSFVYGVHKEQPYHVPGYTGHVPGVRAQYSNTYGSTTRNQIREFHAEHPRPHPQEKPGYAYTSFPRQYLHIDSAPISGAPTTQKAPQKLIPRKLEHLQFFAM